MLKLLQQVENLTRGTGPARPVQADLPAGSNLPQAAEQGSSQLPRMFSQVPGQLLALKELTGDPALPKRSKHSKQQGLQDLLAQSKDEPGTASATGDKTDARSGAGTIPAARQSAEDLGAGQHSHSFIQWQLGSGLHAASHSCKQAARPNQTQEARPPLLLPKHSPLSKP